jgi:hypothetical protein
VFFTAVCREHPDLGLPQWPLWHVSVAYLSPLGRHPVSVALWTRETRQDAIRTAYEVLRDVGMPERQVQEDGVVAIHLRRAMTVAEATGLRSLIRARRSA